MTTRRTRITAGLATAVLAVAGLSACTGSSDKAKERDTAQSSNTANGPTLEQTNLEAKRKLEENPNAIGYVYLFNQGDKQPVGYYVSKGKISSNGSQRGPMDEAVRYCKSGECSWLVVDSKQDDGSYGDPDPGIFFFLTDGTKVVTDLPYLHSTQPLTLNVPKLG